VTSTGPGTAVESELTNQVLGGGRLPRWLLARAGDERLVGLLRSGQPAAFEAIYDRHHRPILSFCRHMLGSREDAEDAVQQTFVSAHRDLVVSTKAIELRPWLYALARNRCLSLLRTRQEAERLDEQPDGIGVSVEGVAETVQRRQELRELVADVATLPENQRVALVLFELRDLSHAQIAQVLACQTSQVKSLVFQARTNLMSQRAAREIDCRQIREEIANGRGSALLRGHLRRHLRGCRECSAYADAVREQRSQLALILPAIPSAALKTASIGGALGAHASAGGGAKALGLAGGQGLAAKALIGATLVGGATAAGVVALHQGSPSPRTSQAKAQDATLRSRSPGPPAPATATAARESTAQARHRVDLPRRVSSPSSRPVAGRPGAPTSPLVAGHPVFPGASRGNQSSHPSHPSSTKRASTRTVGREHASNRRSGRGRPDRSALPAHPTSRSRHPHGGSLHAPRAQPPARLPQRSDATPPTGHQ